MTKIQFLVAFTSTTILASISNAQIVSWSSMQPPTYSNVVDFDGDTPGPITAYSAPGVDIVFDSGSGDIGDPGVAPWGTDNALNTSGGINFQFDTDVDSFLVQYLDQSGPLGPFSGGFGVILFDDGIPVDVIGGNASTGDGLGNQWLNVTANGTAFDEVRFATNGPTPATDLSVDNLSWNVVPEPTSLALLGLGGLLLATRRRG